jgi:hypothetical protein
MHLLSLTFYCLAVLSIIALGFLVVSFARYMNKRSASRFSTGNSEPGFPVKSAVAFVGAALLTLLVALSVTSLSRREVLKFISDAQALKVYVNNQPASNSDEIIAALKTLQPVTAHHSHPTRMIRIELHSDTGVVTIECGRDSANAQEYWVFYPKHGITSNNEIGRITTSALNSY